MRPSPAAFIAFLEDREDWVFGYGPEPRTHDCARFCGAGVKAMTGVDPLKRFSGQWTTQSGARRILARHGGLAAAVGTVMSPISPTLAPRGSVGLVHGGGLVLVEGALVVGPGPERGLVRADRSSLIAAWTVAETEANR